MEDIIKKCPKDWEYSDGNIAGFRIHFRPEKKIWICGYAGKGTTCFEAKTPKEALEGFFTVTLPKIRGL